jgi:SAM-dependent methyltransferase
MLENLKRMWDERYCESQYAYGKEPNEYFKKYLTKFKPKSILLPAEGEGRNAVFASTLGWEVTAFDISEEGKKKALQLANQRAQLIKYDLGLLPGLNYKEEQFDAIGLCYAHFPATMKDSYYKKFHELLKPGGVVIFEAFSKEQIKIQKINPDAGGPRDVDLLFSKEEIKSYFPNYQIIELLETEVDLNEGNFHKGLSQVLRFVGVKQ